MRITPHASSFGTINSRPPRRRWAAASVLRLPSVVTHPSKVTIKGWRSVCVDLPSGPTFDNHTNIKQSQSKGVSAQMIGLYTM